MPADGPLRLDVGLDVLVAEMAREPEPMAPVASIDAPLPALLDGEPVWITAILERTAVYATSPSTRAARQLTGLRRFVVDRSRVHATERRDPHQQRKAAYNGRAARLRSSRVTRIRTAADAARVELEALRQQVVSDPQLAVFGAEVDRVAALVAELAAAAASGPTKAGAA